MPGPAHGSFRRGLTDVFLHAIQYPDEYRARLSGGSPARMPGTHRLFVRANPHATRISLTVAPR